MSIFDWAIIVILGISVLIGIRRGFVKEALSLITWVAAVVVAWVFGEHLAVLLDSQIESASFRLIGSYVILFIGALVVGGVVNYVMSEFVKITGLTGADRVLGMFFGLARGALIIFLIVASLHHLLPAEKGDWYQQSILVPEILAAIEVIGPVVWDKGELLLQNSQAQQAKELRS